MPETPILVADEVFAEEAEAELTAWSVADGEAVQPDQAVAELSTSKAIVDAVAPVAGVLRQRLQVGALVTAGQTIGVVEHE
jgi:pyruvate/2-oxoglutarate dehydrogenase complex dihydrolipoamide acyltransferase (E2) component